MKQFTISQKIYMGVKRVIDILLSALALILLSWLFLILCIAIKIDSRGPILFKQKRVGIHKTHFMIYKFRTMRIDTPKDMPTHMLADPEQYITRVGKFLRKSSLDELPQLFNILKGDISIVGPRPIVEKETQIYGDDVEKLLSVKPGLTGYWQAYARNNATYESGERQKMEMYYVEHNSLWLDIKILFKTVISVIKKEGAQ